MKIQGNAFIKQAISQLVPKKQDAEKKKETMHSEVRRQLEELKRIVKEEEKYQERMDAERIAKKIARGEQVTDEERQKLGDMDPQGLMKAEHANQVRKTVRAQLANATTKEQVNTILLDNKVVAGKLMEQGEQQLSELVFEAIDAAEREYKGNKQPPLAATKQAQQESVFDMRR